MSVYNSRRSPSCFDAKNQTIVGGCTPIIESPLGRTQVAVGMVLQIACHTPVARGIPTTILLGSCKICAQSPIRCIKRLLVGFQEKSAYVTSGHIRRKGGA